MCSLVSFKKQTVLTSKRVTSADDVLADVCVRGGKWYAPLLRSRAARLHLVLDLLGRRCVPPFPSRASTGHRVFRYFEVSSVSNSVASVGWLSSTSQSVVGVGGSSEVSWSYAPGERLFRCRGGTLSS
jgi:hypothetical protein